MEKIREIFLKCSKNIVYILFASIILYLFLVSLFTTCTMAYTDEHIFFIKDYPQLLLPGLLVLLFILFRLKVYTERKKSERGDGRRQERLCERILTGITIIWFIVLLWWVLKAPAVPTADQASVFLRAKDFLEGDYTFWQPGEYMDVYPYQNAMVLFFAAFHFLFGGAALTAIKLFNLVCWYLGILAVCKLTGRYFGRGTAIGTYLALLWFFPAWSYVTFVYGTIPGLCCALWGVLQEKKFEETDKNRHLILTGILLLFAVLWKSNYIIFVIAVSIMLSVYAVREGKIKPLLGIVWTVGLYLAGNQGVLAFVEAVTGSDAGRGILFIGSIVDGLQESVRAPGWYNGYAEILYSKYRDDTALMKMLAVEDLKSTVSVFAQQPDYALRFFARKTASMWSFPFLECNTIITKLHERSHATGIFENILYDGQSLNVLLLLWLDVLQSILYFGTILYLIFGRKKADLKKAGLIICFLGGFLFYLFWEAKCQYILPYYLLLFPYGVEGFRAALQRFTEVRTEWKVKGQDGRKGHLKMLARDNGVKCLLAVVALVVLIWLIPGNIMNSAFKFGVDTVDYIWFCNNNTINYTIG